MVTYWSEEVISIVEGDNEPITKFTIRTSRNIFNLVAQDTREGKVMKKIFNKLEVF
jgi:predicted transcriptional regulator